MKYLNSFLYDWFNPLTEDLRWISNSGETTPVFIKEISECISKRFQVISCNEWNEQDFIGGIKVTKDKICVFRLFNAGRDKRGRPHRWVMLVVLLERQFDECFNIFDALNCNFFRQYAKTPILDIAVIPDGEPTWENLTPTKMEVSSEHVLRCIEDLEKLNEQSRALISDKKQEGLILVKNIRNNIGGWISTFTIKQEKSHANTVEDLKEEKDFYPRSRIKMSFVKYFLGWNLAWKLVVPFGLIIIFMGLYFLWSRDDLGRLFGKTDNSNEICDPTKLENLFFCCEKMGYSFKIKQDPQLKENKVFCKFCNNFHQLKGKVDQEKFPLHEKIRNLDQYEALCQSKLDRKLNEPSKEFLKESPKESPKEPSKGFPKEPSKESPKEPSKGFPKEPSKEFPKEPSKESQKNLQRNS